MIDLDELEATARAATPCMAGWEVRSGYLVYSDVADESAAPIAACAYGGNASYIALANPKAMLALIERLRAAEQ